MDVNRDAIDTSAVADGAMLGIQFHKIYESSVYDVYVKNAWSWGIMVIEGANIPNADRDANILIENCILDNCGKNLTLSSGLHGGIISTHHNGNLLIRGNICRNSNANGIILEDATKRNIITNNRIKDNSGDGIFTSGANLRSCIIGNIIDSNGRDGIDMGVGAARFVVANNLVQSNTEYGMNIKSGLHTIQGNICYQNGESGIFIDNSNSDATNCSVVGNFCENNGQSAPTYGDGITCIGGTSRSTFTGNVCYGASAGATQVYGIRNTSNTVAIVANVCQNNATGQLSDTGATTQVANNIIT